MKEKAIERLLKVANDEIGYLEKGGPYTLYDKTLSAGKNNYTKYGYEMHRIDENIMDYPAKWCDTFVDWCFKEAFGVELAQKMLNGFDDFTPYSAKKFVDMDSWHMEPEEGDQIFFKDRDNKICHTGIVYKVTFDTVYTIEGNTPSHDTEIENDGCVRKKSYNRNSVKIAGYGRPKYELFQEEND